METYYERNKEKRLEYQNRYYRENKDKQKRYYQENKQKILLRQHRYFRQYYQEHIEFFWARNRGVRVDKRAGSLGYPPILPTPNKNNIVKFTI